jgi:nudix-type nucleoside diphosphatase (YffH/AdpP family)
MTPRILTRDTVYSGYMTVEKLRLRLADGAESVREVESHGDAVAVLPYDAQARTALLVRLFRVPAWLLDGQEQLEEACAGMIDAGETPQQSVRREAMEELGLELGALELVARAWPSPGVSSERVWLFLAPYSPADLRGPGGGVASENEGITVVERSLAALATAAEAGGIADLKLLALLLALKARRPQLFV